MATPTEDRRRLRDAGFIPVPLASEDPSKGKRPLPAQWQTLEHVTDDLIVTWEKQWPTSINTGIVCGDVACIDIDVMDGTIANAIQDRTAELIGESGNLLVRFGLHPKRAIPFQTTARFQKLNTGIFISPDGTRHHVEVLASGQQFAAFGIHPVSGRPYEWPHGTPGEIKREDLPVLTESMARQFIADAKGIMSRHGWRPERVERPEPPYAIHRASGTRERAYAIATLENLASELAAMAPETGRNDKLNKSSFKLGQMASCGWIGEATVRGRFFDACVSNGYVASDGREAFERTFHSGFDDGLKEPFADLKDREEQAKPAGNEPAPKPSEGVPVVPEWPDLTEEGQPKRTYRNARAAVTALGVICSYDEFHDRMLVGGHPINQWAGELSDAVNVILRQAIIEAYDFDPGKENIADATTELCLERRFNPVIDYLDGLEWDQKPRLDKWLTTYLGAEHTELNNAIGRLSLVAAVRRAKNPGCKFDHILTLEGSEGTMKSTSIVTLAGVENFSDQTILTASDKEQQELVRGVWLFEIADLAGMRRADVEKIKAFATRTHDRARPAYGRRRVDAPRRCTFIATTNEDEYLQSASGNRRFWPVRTSAIDIGALKDARNQLWAEAVAAEAKGDPLTLPKDLWKQASAAQDERRLQDPWDGILMSVKGTIHSDTYGEEERIASDELLTVNLNIAPGKAHSTDEQRLRRAMNRIGWQGPKVMRFGAMTKRGYFKRIGKTSEIDVTA